VATPGRLIDHLENSGLAQRLAGVRYLVLDEADQLLEMGFRPAIEKILGYLPRSRQTLLFSATLPQAVTQVVGLAMKPDHRYIDTVGEEASDTHLHVHQSYVIMPLEQQFSFVHGVLARARQQKGCKVIAFFTTARLTQYYAELMNATGIPVMEIHSRKSQAQRTRTSDQFRAATQGILFSSDVSGKSWSCPLVPALPCLTKLLSCLHSAGCGLPGHHAGAAGGAAVVQGAVRAPAGPDGACGQGGPGHHRPGALRGVLPQQAPRHPHRAPRRRRCPRRQQPGHRPRSPQRRREDLLHGLPGLVRDRVGTVIGHQGWPLLT
jgi:hypothetical protein